MSMPESVKKELGEALQKIAKYAIKNCYFCGGDIKFGRAIFNGRPAKGALYIRYLVVCPRCNEDKVKEIEDLKQGERFDLGIFNA